jgi:DNA-binding SARP family transcriptional activator
MPPAGNAIRRARVAAWFASTRDLAVRVVCAPVGAGKTVAVRQYVEQSAGKAAYGHVPPGASVPQLHALLEALDAEEVVLDDLDAAAPEARVWLVDRMLDRTFSRRAILVGRSRRRLHLDELLAKQAAHACDPAALAFDAAELEELAGLAAIAHDAHDVAQLLYDTEGWPLAAHWLIRDAVRAGRSLRDAFMHWRERNAHLLFEFLESEHGEEIEAFASFRRLLVEGWSDAQDELERLDELGLPIVRTRSGVRPYRILARLAAPGDAMPREHLTTATIPMMLLNVLGRFRCEIAGRPVAFGRRRDRQLFVFVALAPEGRTTREQLLEAFWPDVESSVASQGLRPALNRIRRAIHEAAPEVDPDRYFTTTGEIAVDTRTVAVDARRFVDRVEQGRLDDARGATDGAKHHYRVARRIYADRLLASEGAEPCLERRVGELEALYVEALTRLTELHAATGELETARGYAAELLARNNEAARRREGVTA